MRTSLLLSVFIFSIALIGCKKDQVRIKSIEGLWNIVSLETEKNGVRTPASLEEYSNFNVNYDFDWSAVQRLGTYSSMRIIDSNLSTKLAVYKISTDRKSLEIRNTVSSTQAKFLTIEKWTEDLLVLTHFDKQTTQTFVASYHKYGSN